MYNSKIPAVEQLDSLLMSSNIYMKTELQKLMGEKKEKRLVGTFYGILYNRKIPAVKQLYTLLMSSNIEYVLKPYYRNGWGRGRRRGWVGPSVAPCTTER